MQQDSTEGSARLSFRNTWHELSLLFVALLGSLWLFLFVFNYVTETTETRDGMRAGGPFRLRCCSKGKTKRKESGKFLCGKAESKAKRRRSEHCFGCSRSSALITRVTLLITTAATQ